MKVIFAMPHYYKEKENAAYGSSRGGQRQARSLALIQCISSLLSMQKATEDLVLNIGEKGIQKAKSENNQESVEIDVNIFTDGKNILSPAIKIFGKTIKMHKAELNDSRHLPLKARDYLIEKGDGYDLCIYMEDDLIIRDSQFLEKQKWIIERCKHKAVLMPHRTEWVPMSMGQRLLVDGPLRSEFIKRYCSPKTNIARGIFQGREVVFDQTDNPHSGLFCISGRQAAELAKLKQPVEGFISPLETAATLTVLSRYTVLKPSWKNREFLWVEHGHPSFQSYCSQWPRVGEPI